MEAKEKEMPTSWRIRTINSLSHNGIINLCEARSPGWGFDHPTGSGGHHSRLTIFFHLQMSLKNSSLSFYALCCFILVHCFNVFYCCVTFYAKELFPHIWENMLFCIFKLSVCERKDDSPLIFEGKLTI